MQLKKFKFWGPFWIYVPPNPHSPFSLTSPQKCRIGCAVLIIWYILNGPKMFFFQFILGKKKLDHRARIFHA